MLTDNERLELTAQLVIGFVKANQLPPSMLASVIQTMHAAVVKGASPLVPERPDPAVPLNKSITHDWIICLEDGKPLKSMKRYLARKHGLTPEEYRKRWGLPYDYPMVAPAYRALRSGFAKQAGLGRGGVSR